MDTQNAFSLAVAEYVARQPWAVRRKDTILAVAGGVLQLAQIATTMATGAPAWVPLVIGAVIMVAQAVVHAFTPGAVTPSMGARLEKAYVGVPPTMYSDSELRASAEYEGESWGRHAA